MAPMTVTEKGGPRLKVTPTVGAGDTASEHSVISPKEGGNCR